MFWKWVLLNSPTTDQPATDHLSTDLPITDLPTHRPTGKILLKTWLLKNIHFTEYTQLGDKNYTIWIRWIMIFVFTTNKKQCEGIRSSLFSKFLKIKMFQSYFLPMDVSIYHIVFLLMMYFSVHSNTLYYKTDVFLKFISRLSLTKQSFSKPWSFTKSKLRHNFS